MRLSCLIAALLLLLVSVPAAAQTHAWEVCEGSRGPSAPKLSGCRPVEGPIDPQGREIWITTRVDAPPDMSDHVLRITGTASSESWLNDAYLGSNGRPGDDARSEVPGRYDVEHHISPSAWRAGDNVVSIRLSSFHARARLTQPMGAIKIAPRRDVLLRNQIAVNLVLLGLLMASAFGFGVIHRLRRTTSSLLLTGMATAAALLALLEALPFVFAYSYPFHIWRLTGQWLLTAGFSFLLVAYSSVGLPTRTRPRLVWLTVVGVATMGGMATADLKTIGTLGFAVVVACMARGLAPRRAPSREAWLYLAAVLGLAAASLAFFAELVHLLLIASLLLPMLMLRVARLGRDDLLREQALAEAASAPDRLAVTTGRRVMLVPVSDIAAIQGADDYVELVLVDGRRLLHTARLDHLETRLPPTFVRVHRSTIANLAHAEALERDGDASMLKLRTAGPLRVSRSRVAHIRAALLKGCA